MALLHFWRNYPGYFCKSGCSENHSELELSCYLVPWRWAGSILMMTPPWKTSAWRQPHTHHVQIGTSDLSSTLICRRSHPLRRKSVIVEERFGGIVVLIWGIGNNKDVINEKGKKWCWRFSEVVNDASDFSMVEQPGHSSCLASSVSFRMSHKYRSSMIRAYGISVKPA